MMDLIELQLQCSKQWSDMKPTSNGGFCATCSTNLVDFTRFSNEEIHQYLETNQGKKTCGKFTKSQLSFNSPALFQPLAQFSLKAVILGLVFSSAMSFDVKAESAVVLGGTLLHGDLVLKSYALDLKIVERDKTTVIPLAKVTVLSRNGLELGSGYSLLDGGIILTDIDFESAYQIKIERDGYVTKTVLYSGELLNSLQTIKLTKK